MKIVYMGTPDFAVPALEALVQAGHEIAGVVTQPDRQKGRGGKVQFPPVKEAALKHGFCVYQPERVAVPEFIHQLKEIAPELIVVAAFGQILPKEILELPQYGCINIHASLLPKLRGAAPIQWAILEGEEVTGLTTMYMDEGLDTGDMLEKVEVKILPEDTGESLHDKLAKEGGPLILRTIEKLCDGTLVRTRQDDAAHTYAKMLHKELGKIDFTWPAEKICRYVRGLLPWPGTFTSYQKKTLKLWEAAFCPESKEDVDKGYDCGTVVRLDKNYIYVQTGKDLLVMKSVQLEGKKRMDAASFLRGVPMKEGDRLG